jgi:ribosomal protein S18 acetylase RimI-like enzyme
MARPLQWCGGAVNVRRTTADDGERLREIRLEALERHPAAFSADLADAKALTPEQWRANAVQRVTFFAEHDGAVVGMSGYGRDAGSKVKHGGNLYAMYVRKDARGTGAGDALVKAVLDHAGREVEQIRLTVEADNVPAIRLYERHGFRVVGRLPRALRIGAAYYDELVMFRRLP